MSGHSKNITSLILLTENKLVSGSEDKAIKIWDIPKRLCTCTITGNYERIESLLKINEHTIAAGSQNTIRFFNTENKKELFTLIGHEKGVCLSRHKPPSPLESIREAVSRDDCPIFHQGGTG
jgi:WD40 repeat protein